MRPLAKYFVIALTVLVIVAIVAITYINVTENANSEIQTLQCQKIMKLDYAQCKYIVDHNVIVVKDVTP